MLRKDINYWFSK